MRRAHLLKMRGCLKSPPPRTRGALVAGMMVVAVRLTRHSNLLSFARVGEALLVLGGRHGLTVHIEGTKPCSVSVVSTRPCNDETVYNLHQRRDAPLEDSPGGFVAFPAGLGHTAPRERHSQKFFA